jgi:hypothetical protein
MAQETLTVQDAARTGAELNEQSVTAADGFKFQNDGRTVMIITEQNSAACDVTVTPTLTVDGLTPSSRVVEVGAGKTYVLGPWPPEQYNDSDGYLEVTIEADQADAVALVRV